MTTIAFCKKKNILKMALVLSGASWAAHARAGDEVLTLPFPSTVAVDYNAPANSLITPWVYSKMSSREIVDGAARGTAGWPAYFFGAASVAKVPGIDGGLVDVMDLGHGIGLALQGRFLGKFGWGPWLDSAARPDNRNPWNDGDGIIGQFAAALVRLNGDVSGGHIEHTTNVAEEGLEYSSSLTTDNYFYAQLDVNISVPTCQMQTKNISVPMGTDISTSTFSGVGSASTPHEFLAKMTCPAGIPNLSYQFDPAGGSSVVGNPKNGTLSLSNTGGASGVGVQITDDDDGSTPVGLQEKRSFGGLYNPNKGGDVSIGWKARYIQTESNVKGGEADAQATITLSYQ